ncbi:protein kinase [Flavobacterium sp. 316]|uniref:serine/threonine protein kinase n=1 Tax=Flavobacterium sp. 316 TaxID=1603293 RepID=UPI000696E931|nr:protein kinase [Flavobacterium sp. 316]
MEIVNVIREIHQGGFGVIHEVELKDGSRVARKTFNPIMKEKMNIKTLSEFKRRFSREVKIQEKLPSDFFIEILYSSLDSEDPWFLMPIAEKVFTEEISQSKLKRRYPEGLADILNCLEHLHDRGYIHRDLKPGNILLHDGKWKLADLGLITSDAEMTSSFATAEGFHAGSLLYMAPEQHTHFNGVTHHADIYSFGAILHDIFNGTRRVPYKKLSANGSIGVIIEKCTEEDIHRRFNDVSTLRNVLLSYLSKTEITNKDITEEISKWIDDLKVVETWDSNKLDSFVIYLDHIEGSKEIIFYEISSYIIELLFKIDFYLWKRFVLMYLEWIYSSRFNFDYCDVLIGHVSKIFVLTDDLEIKSNAALTAAELGRSHNRWYVMNFVLKMCSSISDNLADRIAIEIHVGGDSVKNNFIACAERINTNIDKYHKKIYEVLN